MIFGKDGSVRPNIEQLGDTTKAQEEGLGQKLLSSSGLELGKQFIVLRENDHDLLFDPPGRPPIIMQCTEVVYHDFLLPTEADSSEYIVVEGKTCPIDANAWDTVIAKRIREKLEKNYSKPTDAEFVLLIWTVTGCPFPIQNAADFVAEQGPGPFDRILFFDLMTMARQIWPVDANAISKNSRRPKIGQAAVFIPAQEMRVVTKPKSRS